MVIAPEHSLTELISTRETRSVNDYIKALRLNLISTNDLQRKDRSIYGRYAVNPVNLKKIPIGRRLCLTGYGTGAIMAVPAQIHATLNLLKNLVSLLYASRI